MARHYGWRLATGMTVADVEAWPERLKQVTVEDIRDVARKYLVDKNSVTGILVPAPDKTSTAVSNRPMPQVPAGLSRHAADAVCRPCLALVGSRALPARKLQLTPWRSSAS